MWKVQWDTHMERAVASLPELDALLDALHSGHQGADALAVVVESPQGDSLMIGVGEDVSVLNYVAASGDPPYWSSVGDETEDGLIAFCYMGEWSEGPLRNAIPFQQAREAVRYFFETGALSPLVKWEID